MILTKNINKKLPLNNYNKNQWLYIGNSYEKLIIIEKKLGKSELTNKFSKHFSTKINEYKDLYLDYLSEISKNANIAWHLSETAENNTMSNDLFLDICYINALLDFLNKYQDLIIIFDNPTLLAYCKKQILKIYQDNCNINHFESKLIHTLKRNLTIIYSYLKNTVGFISITLYKRILYNHYLGKLSKINSDDGLILVHTFLHDSCFRNNYVFSERSYEILIPLIKNINNNLYYIMHKGSSTYTDMELAKWCKSSKDKFIVVEQLVSLRDLVVAIIIPFKLLFIKVPLYTVGQIEISTLVKHTLQKESYYAGISFHYLYYVFIRNLSRKNISANFMIDIYEGHILEIVLRYALKKYMPLCKTIGFAHGGFGKNNLSYFTIKGGQNYRVPNILLSLGRLYKNILTENGLKKAKHFVIGNIRSNLPKNIINDSTSSKNTKNILVALPLLRNDAQELLLKIVKAYRDTIYEIQIFIHPMMRLSFLISSDDFSLPANIKISTESTNVGLTTCDLVVTTASTVSLNAMKIGIPVISVKRDIGLTFEPADWFASEIVYATSPEDIINETIKIFNMSSTKLNMITKKNKIIADSCLEDVNENEIRSFISELIQ